MDGVGKRSAAMATAMTLNCQRMGASREVEQGLWMARESEADACGECRSCRKISAGLHPDVMTVMASGATIRIEQIRGLCDTLRLKPFEARVRVAWIAGADAMTPAAANALLKILEEPPPRTILILTAAQSGRLLPTIASRCQMLRFSPIGIRELAHFLETRHGISREDAFKAAGLAEGSIPKALKWVTREALRRRDWILDTLSRLGSGTVSQWLAFAEKLLENKSGLQEDLNLVKTWVRDLIVFKWEPAQILHRDKMASIAPIARPLAVAQILEAMKWVETAQRRIQSNSNPRLTLEILMLRMGRLTHAGTPADWPMSLQTT